jgi:hypothetical protein
VEGAATAGCGEEEGVSVVALGVVVVMVVVDLVVPLETALALLCSAVVLVLTTGPGALLVKNVEESFVSSTASVS